MVPTRSCGPQSCLPLHMLSPSLHYTHLANAARRIYEHYDTFIEVFLARHLQLSDSAAIWVLPSFGLPFLRILYISNNREGWTDLGDI